MTDLAGFDVCFAIGAGGLGQALQSQIQPSARDALRGMQLPLSNAPTSILDVNVTVVPTATIAGAQQRVTSTLTGSANLRMGVNATTMVTIPPGVAIPGGLANVPISVAVPSINASLVMGVTRGAGVSQVVIGDPVTVTVQSPLPDPNDTTAVSNFAAPIATALTSAVNTIIAGSGVTLNAAQVTATATAIAREVREAVNGLIQRRLEGLFPLPIAFTMPAVNASAFCDIGIRDVQVRLLGGGAQTAPCIAIATKLMPSGSGTIGNLVSPLPTGQAAGLFFDNTFLVSIVCCALRSTPEFSTLPAPTTTPTAANQCCTWTGLNAPTTLGGQAYRVRTASVCIDSTNPNNKKFAIHLGMTASGFGWDADITVDVKLSLIAENGAVVPRADPEPVVDVQVHLAWWVVLIEIVIGAVLTIVLAGAGLLVGFILAGLTLGLAAGIGAGIGALIGIVLSIVISIAINDALTNSVSAALRSAAGVVGTGLAGLKVIPDELLAVFGRLEIATVHFDDVQVLGHVVVPPPHDERTLLDVRDIVLRPGEGIDLDRGAVVATNDPGCDLAWRTRRVFPTDFEIAERLGLPAKPTLEPRDFPIPGFPPHGPVGPTTSTLAAPVPAGLVTIGNLSYAAVHLTTVQALPFGSGGGVVFAKSIPLDVTEPLRPLVFGARTGEGLFAKCSAWRLADGTLHLRYALWDTPGAVRLTQQWTSQRGAVVQSPTPLVTTYEVARTGTFHAIPGTLHAPVTYTWEWNGQPLASGAGPLPGGVDSVTVTGATCVLRTAFGVPLDGELCVLAQDPFNVRANVCRTLRLAGTESESLFQAPEAAVALNPRSMIELWLAIHGGDPAPELEIKSQVATQPVKTIAAQLQQELGKLVRG